jgi:hypothetical protein
MKADLAQDLRGISAEIEPRFGFVDFVGIGDAIVALGLRWIGVEIGKNLNDQTPPISASSSVNSPVVLPAIGVRPSRRTGPVSSPPPSA